jgi:hypothetical protein
MRGDNCSKYLAVCSVKRSARALYLNIVRSRWKVAAGPEIGKHPTWTGLGLFVAVLFAAAIGFVSTFHSDYTRLTSSKDTQ